MINDFNVNSAQSKFANNKKPFAQGYNQEPVLNVLKYELSQFRENEISQLIDILNKKNFGNAMIVGDYGVGRSNFVKGAVNVVKTKLGKNIVELNAHFLFHLIQAKSQFDEKVINILNNMAQLDDTILYIDNFEIFFNEYKGNDLNFDMLLSTFIEKNAIKCIFNVAKKDYHIYANSYIGKFFDPIYLNELSEKQNYSILEQHIAEIEHSYNATINKDLIPLVYNFANRYLFKMGNPKASIYLLETAVSNMKNNTNIINNVSEKSKTKLLNIPTLQKEIEDTIILKNESIQNKDFIAAETYKREQNNIELTLNNLINEINVLNKDKYKLTESHIRTVISNITQIPINQLTVGGIEKIKHLKERLSEKIINQDNAINKITAAMKRNSIGIRDENKPIGVFLFVGPTGTGKTYLTKILAKSFFTSEKDIIRLDMSEYSNTIAVNKLFGAAPGYIGYEEGGILTNQVDKKPYSIVLFDEIEKAHSSVYNALLQIFDEGRMTDNKGKEISFKNTIIIMTSNIGCHTAVKKLNIKKVGFNNSNPKNIKQQEKTDFNNEIKAAIKKTFTPEFINRIDDTILFNTLELNHLEKIIKLELLKISDRLTKNNLKINIKFNKNIEKEILKQNKDNINIEYGAREIKRLLIDFEDAITDFIIKDPEVKGNISIAYKNNKYVIKLK